MKKYVKNKWNQISVKQFLSSVIKEEKMRALLQARQPPEARK